MLCEYREREDLPDGRFMETTCIETADVQAFGKCLCHRHAYIMSQKEISKLKELAANSVKKYGAACDEIARLREAINKYGRHLPDCPANLNDPPPIGGTEYECICGAIKKARP